MLLWYHGNLAELTETDLKKKTHILSLLKPCGLELNKGVGKLNRLALSLVAIRAIIIKVKDRLLRLVKNATP